LVKNGVRIAALLAVAAGTILAVIYHAAIDPVAIRNFVLGNPLAPVMFVALQVVASLLFVPRTVLGMAAGLLFGLWWGLVWAILGAIAGASAGFAFVRWLGAEGSLDTSPGIGRLVQRAERGGWRAVAIVRLTPFPHSIANTALALTKVSWRDYLVGSSLGMLPMTAAQVSMGASGGQFLQGHGSWVVACLLLAAGLAASFLLKRAGANRTSRS
jgi:uncharacterized membrane protein YdjX (TVP38/TMEM64 family)